MSFDFSTLITDRSRADLDALRDMLSTPMSDWTAEQLAAFNLAASKGAYNFTDLNRVTEAMEALDGMLSGMGYKTGYAPVVVHPAEPAPPSQYTYRYFRMQINAVRSGTQMQMSEIRLVDESGNFFQFPAGTTVSSTMSVPVADEAPANLIDGLVTTKYYTNAYTTGGIITIDLGDGQGADLLVWTKWQWYTANDEPNRDPVSFVFQGSRDGADWVTLDEAEGATITEDRETLAYTGELKNEVNITPTMTSNTTPDGYVASASSVHETRDAWRAFNGDNQEWHSGMGLPQWLQLQFPEAVRVDSFTIQNPAADTYGTKGITTFSLQGSNNGTDFDTLGTYTNNPDNSLVTRFEVASPGLYQTYRFDITGTGYIFQGNPYCVITEAAFFEDQLQPTEPEPDPEPEVDPYVWYEEDVPTQTQMRLYLNNVAAIYKTLLSEPTLPESMAGLTAAGANQIEAALATIHNFIARIALSFWRCGEILCGEV